MGRNAQQQEYEAAIFKRESCMTYARLLAEQRWDAIYPGARERLERDIRSNVRRAREANQEARRIWNARGV